MNLLQKQHSFKVIFFQIDKELIRNQDKKYEGVTGSIVKVLNKADNSR